MNSQSCVSRVYTDVKGNAPAKNKLVTDAVHMNCKQFPIPLNFSQGLVHL